MRPLLLAILASAVCAAGSTRAAVTYHFVGTSEVDDLTFTVTADTYLGGTAHVTTPCTDTLADTSCGLVFIPAGTPDYFDPGDNSRTPEDDANDLIKVDAHGGNPQTACCIQFFVAPPVGALSHNGAYQSANGWGVLTVSGTPAVPEPAVWALMIGGFGMAGAALRKQRPQASPTVA